ncbi:Para-nitrobenzyl esterase [Vanrija pseudolonga]|uniref:Para-nitrobenzyl esterase n=1 Tax=Vanrija pseudolonga TaxID=143232 RepID=A0AAF0YEE2_9TREE|nr:Para-nitrobenzyl esterase [Vanrija pseudolonga]
MRALLLLAASLTGVLAQCRTTWNGTELQGTLEAGACRYSVRYGTAGRWAPPEAATSQDGLSAGSWPPICPQAADSDDVQILSEKRQEDCLMLVVWAPPNATSTSSLPVFFWAHGGAFVSGSASSAGMNGAAFAADGIVSVFVQYRLGALGFLPPPIAESSNDPNLAVMDVVLALRVVRDNIRAAGGDPGRVTVGGQSAGATLIRSLFGTPSAQGLFHGVVLQSDPLNYGLQSRQNQLDMQNYFYNSPNGSFPHCADMGCYAKVPLDTLIAWQAYVNNTAPFMIPGVAFGLVFRPQYGTQTIPHDPTNALWSGNASRLSLDPAIPVLATTVKNEAGYLVGVLIPVPIPASAQLANFTLRKVVGPERADVILTSGLYPLQEGLDGLRGTIDHVITDGAWHCVTRAMFRRWAGAGGRVYLGTFTRGLIYLYNAFNDYCRMPGVVCHGDDIYPVFSSQPNPTADNATYETTIRTYWSTFIKTGSPSADSHSWPQWTPNSTDGEVTNLGKATDMPLCPADFWGSKVKFDFQMYSSNDTGILPARG